MRFVLLLCVALLACGGPSPATAVDAGGGGLEAPDAGDAGSGGGAPETIDAGPLGPGHWDSSVGAADCAAAWGADGRPLSACDTVKDNYVVVHKSYRNLALCNAGTLVKSYRSGLGKAPVGDKEHEGDNKTPEGVFYVASLNAQSSYYKAFLFSYPDSADADRGLDAGLINGIDKAGIDSAQASCGVPDQYTGLGGLIEVHGDGSATDWTNGCVALDNPSIDVLWATLQVGDSIVVLP